MPRRPRAAAPPTTIYSFDPGVTTGMAVFSGHDTLLSQLKLPEMPRLQGFFAQRPPSVVVIEDFQSNPAKNLGGRASVDPIFAPVRLAAQIEVYAALTPKPPIIVYQLPSDKALMDDNRLRLLHEEGYRSTVGLPHARDALRHLLVYLRRARRLSPIEP